MLWLYLHYQICTGTASTFELNVDVLEATIMEQRALGRAVKAFFLVNPNNPLGEVYSSQLVLQLMEVCHRSALVLLVLLILDKFKVLSSVRYVAQWTSVLFVGNMEYLMHWRERCLSTHLFNIFLLVGLFWPTLCGGYRKLFVYFKCIMVSNLSTWHPCSINNFYLTFLCYGCFSLYIQLTLICTRSIRAIWIYSSRLLHLLFFCTQTKFKYTWVEQTLNLA